MRVAGSGAVLSLCCLAFTSFAAQALDASDVCYSNERYSVVEVENDDAPGARFFVSAARDAQPCGFDESGPSQIVGDGESPLWFSDLIGRFLVLTRSTGPQGDLVVYNLESGALVLDVPADDFEAYEGGVTFWERTADATAENCPDYKQFTGDGFGAVIVEKAHFDFGSDSVERTGERRCDPVQ